MARTPETHLRGRTVVMTGATDGIGKVAAERLVGVGADLVVIAREPAKAARLGAVRVVAADLADLASIRAAVEALADLSHIDVLLNNAGVMTSRLRRSVDGFEMNIAVNHLAVAALTLPLLDKLIAAGPGARIVNTNSAGHAAALQGGGPIEPAIPSWRGDDSTYAFSIAYSRSKLANLLWSYELSERLKGSGVTLNALHPGSVRTGLGRELPKIITEPYHLMFSTTPAKGAEPILHLAAAPEVAGLTGAYFDRFSRVRSSAASYDAGFRRAVWDETNAILGPDFPSAVANLARSHA